MHGDQPIMWRPQVTTSLPFPWQIHVWPATPPMATPTWSPFTFLICIPPRQSYSATQGDSVRPAAPLPTACTSTQLTKMEDGVVAAAKTAGRPPGFLLPLLISHLILMFIMFMIYATCVCMQQKKRKERKLPERRRKSGVCLRRKNVDDTLTFSFYNEIK